MVLVYTVLKEEQATNHIQFSDLKWKWLPWLHSKQTPVLTTHWGRCWDWWRGKWIKPGQCVRDLVRLCEIICETLCKTVCTVKILSFYKSIILCDDDLAPERVYICYVDSRSKPNSRDQRSTPRYYLTAAIEYLSFYREST